MHLYLSLVFTTLCLSVHECMSGGGVIAHECMSGGGGMIAHECMSGGGVIAHDW